ncbi:MAG: Gfo/Idh/MocA family oxidoreductase [Armatimonadota bacterium]|nr:Gfo/Idh/MocA family oxidoreductase [Armatimonadota bacterium]
MLKIGIIGLDSSHTIEFARRLVAPDCPAEQKVSGATVTKVMRFETPFQDSAGLDARQKQLESWGIPVTTHLEEATSDCDAIILCINDPSLHLEYFRKIAGLGKPVFVDKPLADTKANAAQILEAAAENKTPFFSCSSLRFAPALLDACSKVNQPTRVSVFGPLGQAAAGSSIVWYGVHAVEMMQRALGRGAQSVRTFSDETGAVLLVKYNDSRRGVVELCRGAWQYGGSVRGKDGAVFLVDTSLLYTDLLREIVKFFETKKAPVEPEDALEVTAILDAAEKSATSGKAEPV